MDANPVIDFTKTDLTSSVIPTMETNEERESIEDTGSTPEDPTAAFDKSMDIFNDLEIDFNTALIAFLVIQIEPGQIASFDAIIAVVHYLAEAPCGRAEAISAPPARSAPPNTYIHLSDALCGHIEAGSPSSSLPPPPDTYAEATCEHEATLLAILYGTNEVDIGRYELPLHRISRHFHWHWHAEELAWGRKRRERRWNAKIEEEGVDLLHWEEHLKSADEFDLTPLKSWKLFAGYPIMDLVDHYTACSLSDGTIDGLKRVSRRLPETRYNWEGVGQEILMPAVPWKLA